MTVGWRINGLGMGTSSRIVIGFLQGLSRWPIESIPWASAGHLTYEAFRFLGYTGFIVFLRKGLTI
jgi:hypothetical protein